MKNVYCIVGPSGAGKTTVANALAEKYGYNVFESASHNGSKNAMLFDLIEQNDLLVAEPEEVETLLNQYCGEKGIRVFGIAPDVEVLVERMSHRGDSDEQIVRSLVCDAEKFKNLRCVADGIWELGLTTDELCEVFYSRIEMYEDMARHEFSLINEYGKWMATKSCDSLEEALEGINKAYPEGIPDGWTVRDDTALLREKYLKAIKRQNPKLKTSHIYIDPSQNNFRYKGYTVVPFKYDGKRYSYCEDACGNTWINDYVRFGDERSVEDILASKIEFAYKKLNRFDNDLDFVTAQDKATKERLEKAVCFLVKALDYAKQKSNKPTLAAAIEKAKAKEKDKAEVGGSVTIHKNERVL